jgi:GT2 family glycosyltransferase
LIKVKNDVVINCLLLNKRWKQIAKSTNNKHNFWNPFWHWNRHYPLNYSKVFYSNVLFVNKCKRLIKWTSYVFYMLFVCLFGICTAKGALDLQPQVIKLTSCLPMKKMFLSLILKVTSFFYRKFIFLFFLLQDSITKKKE